LTTTHHDPGNHSLSMEGPPTGAAVNEVDSPRRSVLALAMSVDLLMAKIPPKPLLTVRTDRAL
jgi:hypothetical protein